MLYIVLLNCKYNIFLFSIAGTFWTKVILIWELALKKMFNLFCNFFSFLILPHILVSFPLGTSLWKKRKNLLIKMSILVSAWRSIRRERNKRVWESILGGCHPSLKSIIVHFYIPRSLTKGSIFWERLKIIFHWFSHQKTGL